MYMMLINQGIDQVHDQMLVLEKYGEACLNCYEGVVQMEAGMMRACSSSLNPSHAPLPARRVEKISRIIPPQYNHTDEKVSEEFELLMEELL